MLKKLLKYDLKYIFKYWWIAALTSTALSFVGGGCITVLRSERNLPEIVHVMSVLSFVFVFLGFMALAILTAILNFARFYQNFFSDEGYLTFTLPVKTTQLLNSKIIMSTIAMVSTSILLAVNVLTMLAIGFADQLPDFFKSLSLGIEEILKEISVGDIIYLITYLIEFIIIGILSIVFSNMFLYCCITLGSTVTKKAKVVTSIGIYYVANMIFSTAIQIFMAFVIPSERFLNLPEESTLLIIALVMLVIILFLGILCTVLYTLQYWMLDRKLNLS